MMQNVIKEGKPTVKSSGRRYTYLQRDDVDDDGEREAETKNKLRRGMSRKTEEGRRRRRRRRREEAC